MGDIEIHRRRCPSAAASSVGSLVEVYEHLESRIKTLQHKRQTSVQHPK